MKYICLEGIEEGNRFYTMNSNKPEPEKLADGTVAYRVLGYADTDEEARKILYGPEHNDPFNKAVRLTDYLMKMPLKQLGISEEDVARLAVMIVQQEEKDNEHKSSL